MNTSAMLDDLGHDVLEAASGPQGLEILRSGDEVDLVITDQAMPKMSGTQLATAIKQHHPDQRIVIATGFAELSLT